MHWRYLTLFCVPMALAACGIGRALTAPARYVFHEPEPTPTTATSDVTNPGRPLVVPSPTPAKRSSSHKTATAAKPSPRLAVSKAKSSPASTTTIQFPVAKPVPGKAGLVFNPFKPNGGYIDVSGYAPGSKVKDPDTQQIFVVP